MGWREGGILRGGDAGELGRKAGVDVEKAGGEPGMVWFRSYYVRDGGSSRGIEPRWVIKERG